MAKQTSKEPGRISQIVDVFKRTIAVDKAALWLILGGFALPIVISVVVGILFPSGVLGWILWVLVGLTTGLLLGMLVLGRRAESAAYRSLEGKPGAVSAVLAAPLKRSFRGTAEPVAVNPRSLTAVYRIVGAPGIVLIGEGNRAEAQHLLEAERKRASKAAASVPIHAIWVTTDGKGTPLPAVVKTLNKMKRSLSRNEVKTVHARLSSLTNAMPIPKGIDPRKMRASRR
ncbi:MAG: DUF4191 family protein [Rhodoluna sp.]|nr:DUF4191 family protein [Rhodoluna sp.]